MLKLKLTASSIYLPKHWLKKYLAKAKKLKLLKRKKAANTQEEDISHYSTLLTTTKTALKSLQTDMLQQKTVQALFI